MKTTLKTPGSNPSQAKPLAAKESTPTSVPDSLTELHVNLNTGLTQLEVSIRRKEHGYNEVTEQKEHPFLKFLGKFWGLSAWMLELIIVFSALLRHYTDLMVVSVLLLINAILSFIQERRAAGVVATLRRRLQVNARVLRDSNWQVIPSRELVPGDIVRARPGDIIPADFRLLTGTLTVDQSALTGESKMQRKRLEKCYHRDQSYDAVKATVSSY